MPVCHTDRCLTWDHTMCASKLNHPLLHCGVVGTNMPGPLMWHSFDISIWVSLWCSSGFKSNTMMCCQSWHVHTPMLVIPTVLVCCGHPSPPLFIQRHHLSLLSFGSVCHSPVRLRAIVRHRPMCVPIHVFVGHLHIHCLYPLGSSLSTKAHIPPFRLVRPPAVF